MVLFIEEINKVWNENELFEVLFPIITKIAPIKG